jgi:hypothetical protein
MAGTIIVSSIKTDTDNSFIVRSNTGATLFSVDTTSISIPDGSITSAMIANGTVIAADILDGTITAAKLAPGAALPSQTSNATYYLTSDGTNAIWKAQTALVVANTQVTGLITAGQIASVANTQITGNITQAQIATGVAGTGPAFSAYHSTTQAISETTWTKCTFNTERFDTNSNYDNATNYRFTPTVAGYYIITSTIASESSLSYLYLELRKNGASEILSIGTATNATGTCVTGVMYLNGSTDYVEAWCFASSGCNLANAAYKTFTGAMIRSA